MIPDLGKYTETVLSAYGISIVLFVALVVLSVMRGRRVRTELKSVEQRMSRDG